MNMTIAHLASPLITGTQKLKNKVVQENPTNPFLMRLPFFKLIVVATMPPFSICYIIREREVKGFDQKRLFD